MADTIGPAEVGRYIEQGGAVCPFCGSDEIQGTTSAVATDAGHGDQRIECLACGKEWRDIYRLTHIEIETDDGKEVAIEPVVVPPRVVITVSGGCCYWAETDGVEVAFLDYDNEPDGELPEWAEALMAGETATP